jgi:hypothetical protein
VGRAASMDDHDGREHKYALARSMLAGDGTEARRILLDGGLYVSPVRKAREKLNSFLGTVRSPKRARATSRIGWHENVFVLPDGAIGASGSNELFLLQHTGSLRHAFRQRGSLSDWQANVARLATGIGNEGKTGSGGDKAKKWNLFQMDNPIPSKSQQGIKARVLGGSGQRTRTPIPDNKSLDGAVSGQQPII